MYTNADLAACAQIARNYARPAPYHPLTHRLILAQAKAPGSRNVGFVGTALGRGYMRAFRPTHCHCHCRDRTDGVQPKKRAAASADCAEAETRASARGKRHPAGTNPPPSLSSPYHARRTTSGGRGSARVRQPCAPARGGPAETSSDDAPAETRLPGRRGPCAGGAGASALGSAGRGRDPAGLLQGGGPAGPHLPDRETREGPQGAFGVSLLCSAPPASHRPPRLSLRCCGR